MGVGRGRSLFYRRSSFVTRLPLDAVYSRSHSWVLVLDGGVCRVGLTRFATRMLGEMVDHGFEVGVGARVGVGGIIGWVEGFKAVSDLYSAAVGVFRGGNGRLLEDVGLVSREPYGGGWLYEVEGVAEGGCVDAVGYSGFLDVTIDRILAEREGKDGGGGREGEVDGGRDGGGGGENVGGGGVG